MELKIIQKKIFEIRGLRVMFDFHIAELYGVETRVLTQAVKRNRSRFPTRFMFRLKRQEYKSLMSQIVISKKNTRGGRQKLPYVFTEHGITMLASVLRSNTAVKVSIAIVDAFVLMKQFQNDYHLLEERIDNLERQFGRKIENINEVIEFLLNPPKEEKVSRNPVGYKYNKE